MPLGLLRPAGRSHLVAGIVATAFVALLAWVLSLLLHGDSVLTAPLIFLLVLVVPLWLRSLRAPLLDRTSGDLVSLGRRASPSSIVRARLDPAQSESDLLLVDERHRTWRVRLTQPIGEPAARADVADRSSTGGDTISVEQQHALIEVLERSSIGLPDIRDPYDPRGRFARTPAGGWMTRADAIALVRELRAQL